MDYTISFRNPPDHYVDIELTCPVGNRQYLDLLLPAWRPGRYELANYAQNIREVKPRDLSGVNLNYKKISRNTWRVYTSGATEIKVSYQFYANQPDAGGSLLDDQQLYLNFINCMLYSHDQLENPCTITLKIDRKFKIACGLTRVNATHLVAENYYQLVDSPLMASPKLKHWKFQQNGIKVNLWFMGPHRLNKNKVLKAFKLFIAEQVKTMDSFPEKHYHFLYQVPGTSVYHGVEHANSTVVTIGPGEELHKSRYQDFLGVSSHEFFHSWNIIKIRPKELLPYNFQKEVYFDTGFIAEGITSYYGDLFLVRSGVFDLKQYFRELNKLFKRHFENEGRHYASLVESSRDLWVDGYKQSAPGRKVSIYTKGALVSLMLDLTIRSVTGNQASLDTVMKRLWKEFGQKSIGYTLKDFQNTCEQIAGDSLERYFQSYIHGVEPLEQDLAQLLDSVGCHLKAHSSRQLTKKIFGFRVIKKDGLATVVQIDPNSPSHRKLSIGDIITRINHKKPDGKLNAHIDATRSLKLAVIRNGRKVNLSIRPGSRLYFTQYRIVKQRKVSDQQKEAFHKWLGVKF